jgi:hypothetical protein
LLEGGELKHSIINNNWKYLYSAFHNVSMRFTVEDFFRLHILIYYNKCADIHCKFLNINLLRWLDGNDIPHVNIYSTCVTQHTVQSNIAARQAAVV